MNSFINNSCSYNSSQSHNLLLLIMAAKAINYSNCELSDISCTHEWIIPNFDTWLEKKTGQWLNDCLFSPAQGIQLQIKILGLVKGPGLIFLNNCGSNSIRLSSWSMDFNFMLKDYTNTRSLLLDSKTDFLLKANNLSEEIPFNWDRRNNLAVWSKSKNNLSQLKASPGNNMLRV